MSISELKFCAILDTGSSVNQIAQSAFETLALGAGIKKMNLPRAVTMVGYYAKSLMTNYVVLNIEVDEEECYC